MSQNKSSLLKVIIFNVIIIICFSVFWLELEKSIRASYLQLNLLIILNIIVPIIFLIVGSSVVTILALTEDTPRWVKWVTSLAIGIGAFLCSSPPNLFGFAAAFLIFLASFYLFARTKYEAEDHLHIKIFHLSQTAGMAQFILAIIVATTLLAVSVAAPKIRRGGIVLPESFFNTQSPIISLAISLSGNKQADFSFFSAFSEFASDLYHTKLGSHGNELNPKDSSSLDKTLEKELNKLNPADSAALSKLLKQNTEKQINDIFKNKSNIVLGIYGLVLFLLLLIFKFPLMMLYGLATTVLYLLLKSLGIICIEEQMVEAHLVFLNKPFK